MSERDRRQLGKVAERVSMAQRGELPLRALVADLEFLLEALDSAEIRKQLREKWEVLEEVYSVSVALRDGEVDAQSLELLTNTEKELASEVGQLLGEQDAPG